MRCKEELYQYNDIGDNTKAIPQLANCIVLNDLFGEMASTWKFRKIAVKVSPKPLTSVQSKMMLDL
jgi:hypothetical protein